MQVRQTPSGNTAGSRDHPSGKLTVFCILVSLAYTYLMYFSLSLAIHLGLEKGSGLLFRGLEHMETIL